MTKGVSGTSLAGVQTKCRCVHKRTDCLLQLVQYMRAWGDHGAVIQSPVSIRLGANVADLAVPAGDNSFRKHAGSGAMPQGTGHASRPEVDTRKLLLFSGGN